MLSFLKNLFTKDKGDLALGEQAEQSVLPMEEVSAQKQPERHETLLSLHQSWEQQLDTNQRYSMAFAASNLPPIATGTVALSGIRILPHEEGVEVVAFVRNGLPRPIRFEEMSLLIVLEDDRLFARQTFDMSEIGEIPSFHARPWSFVFKRENFLLRDLLVTKWKLAFELAQQKLVLPQQLELEESWLKSMTEEQKDAFVELARILPPIKEGEVNFHGVNATHVPSGEIHVILLIRNGSPQALTFQKLPLVLFDAGQQKVAEGVFEWSDFTVQAKTSKPWMFIFPKESIRAENPDLSRWSVNIPSI